MKSLSGSLVFPFDQMVKDSIATHGLGWAVRYYVKKHGIPSWQFRIYAGI
jgi:hypothetical protein